MRMLSMIRRGVMAMMKRGVMMTMWRRVTLILAEEGPSLRVSMLSR